MDVLLNPELRALRSEVTRFAGRCLDLPPDDSRHEAFDRAGWHRAAEFGVLGWAVPTPYGGSGWDPLRCAVAFEALGYGCAHNGLLFAVNNHVWACTVYLVHHGSEEQKKHWLPGLCDGSVIGAHALTEWESGSDVLGIATTAVRHGASGWTLSGTKTFISNAPEADLFVVFARTADAPGQRSLSAFLVPASNPGVRVTRELDKAGLRGTPMGEIHFDGVELGPEHLLGSEGGGYHVFSSTVEWERGFLFASSVGTMQRLSETCAEHAARRRQFGRPIGGFQAVAHAVADMRVRLELAQLMLYKLGCLKRDGRLAMLEASILKLVVSEGLLATALDSVRLHGARGYLAGFGVERELRDALGGTIYGGTSEIQRSIIAELVGLPGSA